jgi:uncharacterized protein YndB with AHSA1/START domain
MADATLTKTIVINAPIHTVWDMLTKRDKLALWFHPSKADMALGETFELYGRDDPDQNDRICWGMVHEMAPTHTLVYDFTIRQMNGVVTKVAWHLGEVMGGTQVTMVHTGLEQLGEEGFGLFAGLDQGWDKHLSTLREQLA